MEISHCYSLIEVIKSKYRVNEDELRDITTCCLLGLEYLHKSGFVHGVSGWGW